MAKIDLKELRERIEYERTLHDIDITVHLDVFKKRLDAVEALNVVTEALECSDDTLVEMWNNPKVIVRQSVSDEEWAKIKAGDLKQEF